MLAFKRFPKAHSVQIASTNPLERLNAEIKRRTDVVGIFPNDAAMLRLVGALSLEWNDEWQLQRRYRPHERIDQRQRDPANLRRRHQLATVDTPRVGTVSEGGDELGPPHPARLLSADFCRGVDARAVPCYFAVDASARSRPILLLPWAPGLPVELRLTSNRT